MGIHVPVLRASVKTQDSDVMLYLLIASDDIYRGVNQSLFQFQTIILSYYYFNSIKGEINVYLQGMPQAPFITRFGDIYNYIVSHCPLLWCTLNLQGADCKTNRSCPPAPSFLFFSCHDYPLNSDISIILQFNHLLINHAFVAEFNHNVIEEQSVQPSHFINKSNGETQLANTEVNKFVDEMVAKQVMTSQVIDLSDDEEVEELSVAKKFPDDMLGSLLWHYLDPQGDIQGPFSLTSLKRWYDADYFPPEFQVWRADRIQDGAVLLKDVLDQNFPN